MSLSSSLSSVGRSRLYGHLSSVLPTLKYRRLRGDMIDVFKIVHNYYGPGASVKFNFNQFGIKVTNLNFRNLHVTII